MRKITNEELGRPSAGEFARMEKMPVAVVLDNVRSMQNVRAFFRTADAFAVERIALCGITATPPNREIHKTALGAELTVAWDYFAATTDCIAALRAQGYLITSWSRSKEPSCWMNSGLDRGRNTPWCSATRWTAWRRRSWMRQTGRSRFRRPEPNIR